MSDAGNDTRIGWTSGATNTGSGTQNVFVVGGAHGQRKPPPDPRSVALGQRLKLSARFVPPPGFGRLRDGLAEPGGVVLVTGTPGSGRRTAAVMALHEAAGRGQRLDEIPFSDNPEDRPDLAKGKFWLLDLSSIAPGASPKAWELLGELWGRVEHFKVRLAVVLPSSTGDPDLSEFQSITREIGRPRELTVLRRHLDAEEVPYKPEELLEFEPPEKFGKFAMREIQRLARLVSRARVVDGAAGVHGWLHSAFDALGERGPEVARRVAALDSGRKRALFLAAAMLEGARTDALFQQTEALLKRVEHTPDEKPGFERADLAERLKELSAEVGDDGRIRFEKLSYGGAVRSHFWTYFPEFRGKFGEWVAETVQDQRGCLSPEERTKVLTRFTEQSLRTGEVGVLQRLAGDWVAKSALGNEARTILEQGLVHEEHGSGFRGWIYDQVTKGEVDPAAVFVLARVCSEVMAQSHPEQALVRLHHLARRASGARGQLIDLARSEGRLYLKLLGRVCEGMDKPEYRQADSEIFLALVETMPRWMPRQEAVRGWRRVLAVAAAEVWEPGVAAWLSAAQRAHDGGKRLMGILIEAADDGIDVLSRYYLFAHDWAAGPDDSSGTSSRAAVAERFCQEIDRVQGIEPLAGVAEGSGL